MARAETDPPSSLPAMLFVADEVALDFINTRYGTGSDHVECFRSDQSVLDWLTRTHLWNELDAPPLPAKQGALLRAALELRSSARELVERRKTRGIGDVTLLNQILASSPVHAQVRWKKGQAPALQQVRSVAGPNAVLAPVAEAIAKLLTEGDFDLVRKCESDQCTLWFYDRTKAHRRRWCDMAVCGNRAKVAAFRERNRDN